jgi:hypothetical protein
MIRYRSLFLFGGALIAAALSFYTDPDAGGLSTLLGGLAIVQGLWAVAAAHLGRKALTDYPEADQRRLFAKAGEHPVGAGLALIALAIVFVGLLLVFAPRAHADTLPAGFNAYGSILKAEQRHYWPDHPDPATLAALVEQESCVSLKSARCWNPVARLKSDREEGAGMGQITRAYRADGSLRFDSLAALRDQYGADLAGWSWDNVYARPDLQLRAVVLMSRDSARPFTHTPAMLAFGDAGYNGGVGGVQKERRACVLSKGCDPGQWFGHVEAHCMKSRQPLYGGRSACDINREHVRNVLQVRRAKYVAAMNQA